MQKPGLFGMNGFIVFLLLVLSFAARAQQEGYLILIDAENKQSFNLRVGDQFYASSGNGHLVLSHLKDSSYRLNLRFPKQNQPELVFPVSVRRKDLGFQLKVAESSWVLYNWQTKETIRPVHELDSTRILDQGIKREDGFSRLMAAVVNDTAVMYNTYKGGSFSKDSVGMSAQHPKPGMDTAGAAASLSTKPTATQNLPPPVDPQTAAAHNQPPPLTQNPPPAGAKQKTAGTKPPSKTAFTPGVKKLREVTLRISRKLTFLDIGKDGITDTVILFVFFEKDSVQKKAAPVPALVATKRVNTDSVSGAKLPPVNKKQDTVGAARTMAKGKIPKSDLPACLQMATDEDLTALRSAILRANTEQEKIAVATGAFALKCFSVSQVRLLASLFVSDKAKYRLMDAAHGHVSDKDHFPELVDMLTDKNFQRKFLAMAEKRS